MNDNMIKKECKFEDVFDIQGRHGVSEVVIKVKHHNWTEFYFDKKEDIQRFITTLEKARDFVFE